MKKNALSMRVFSVILCFAMLCTFTPLTAMAKTIDICVGGIEVTSENAADIFGDQTASYNMDTETLTLNGATITDSRSVAGMNCAVFSEGDLTVVVKGDNYLNLADAAGADTVGGFVSHGNMTITGDGELSVIVPNARYRSLGFYSEKNLLLSVSGKLNVETGAASDSAGFSAQQTTMDCVGDYIAYTKGQVFDGSVVLSDFGFCGTAYIESQDGWYDLTSEENRDALLSKAKSMEISYKICYTVGGVDVCPENANDVLGDGTVSYDADKDELILNNAHLRDMTRDGSDTDLSVIFVHNHENSTIRLIGDNVVDCSQFLPSNPLDYIQGIYATGNLTFVGDGNLTCRVSAVKNTNCYGLYVNNKLAIKGSGDYRFICEDRILESSFDGYGICCGSFAYSGGTYTKDETLGLYAEGPTGAISEIYDGTKILEDNYSFAYASALTDATMQNAEDFQEILKYPRISVLPKQEIQYGVAVCGVFVDVNNYEDVLGDGTVSFDPTSHVLTLCNAQLSGPASSCQMPGDYEMIYVDGKQPRTVAINLVGENEIDLSTFTPNTSVSFLQGIEICGDFVITGPGSLTISMNANVPYPQSGLYSSGDVYIQNEGKLEILYSGELLSDEPTAVAFSANTLKIDNPNVHAVAKYIFNIGDLELGWNVDVFGTYEINGELEKIDKDTDSVFEDWKEIRSMLKVYDLKVQNVQVNSDNYEDVLGDGTVSYDPEESVLTLKDAQLTGGISGHMDTLEVRLEGDNSIDILEGAAISNEAGLKISGEGSLDVVIIPASHLNTVWGIYADYLEYAADGKVNITIYSGANAAFGVFAEDELTLKNNGDLDISVGDVSIESYGVFSNNGISQTGGGKISIEVDGGGNYADGIYCDGDFLSNGIGTVSAVAGMTAKDSFGIEVTGLLSLEKEEIGPKNYYFEGTTRAVQTASISDGEYGFDAQYVAGSQDEGTHSISELESYQCVWFIPPYTMDIISDYSIVWGEEASSLHIAWPFTDSPDYVYVEWTNQDGNTQMEGFNGSVLPDDFEISKNDFQTGAYTFRVRAAYGGEMGELGTVLVSSNLFSVHIYSEIKALEFYIDSPIVGVAPSLYFDYGGDVFLDVEPNFEWYDLTDDSCGRLMQPGEACKAGHQYGVNLTIQAEGQNAFTDQTVITFTSGTIVNKEILEDLNKIRLSVLFDPLTFILGYVDVNASIEGTHGIQDGMLPKDIQLSLRTFTMHGYAMSALSQPMTWVWKVGGTDVVYDEDQERVLSEDKPFTGGENLRLEIQIPLKENVKPNVTNLHLIIDGYPCGIGSDTIKYNEDTNVLTLCMENGRIHEYLDVVDVVVFEPDVTTTPEDSLPVILNVKSPYTVSNLVWQEKDSGTVVPNASLFEYGKTYILSFRLVYDEFYWCDENTVVLINGEKATVERSDVDTINISYEFAPVPATVLVEDLDVTLLSPIAGEKVGEYSEASTNSDAVSYMFLTWYTYNEDTDDLDELDAEEVFEQDKEYVCYTRLVLKSGYLFNVQYASNYTINKDKETPIMYDSKTIRMDWNGYAIAKPEITLTANGSTEFVQSKEVVFSFDANYTFEPQLNASDRKVAVSVYAENGLVVCDEIFDSAKESFTLDLGDDLPVGTYTVRLYAYFRDMPIESNGANFTVKEEVLESSDVEDESDVSADESDADDVLCGDADDDGVLTMKDVLAIRKQLAGLETKTYIAKNADCNGDGNVDLKDVLMLRKYLANLIPSLG